MNGFPWVSRATPQPNQAHRRGQQSLIRPPISRFFFSGIVNGFCEFLWVCLGFFGLQENKRRKSARPDTSRLFSPGTVKKGTSRFLSIFLVSREPLDQLLDTSWDNSALLSLSLVVSLVSNEGVAFSPSVSLNFFLD